jgi:hypothetical protein
MLAFLFGQLMTLADILLSKSHDAAISAIRHDESVRSLVGAVKWVYPIFTSYRSVAPPYVDCENRSYLAWTDKRFVVINVWMHRENMYRDPWDVYAIDIGYDKMPEKVSANCSREFG